MALLVKYHRWCRKNTGGVCPQCGGKKSLYCYRCKRCSSEGRTKKRFPLGDRWVGYGTWVRVISIELRRRDGDICGYCGLGVDGKVVHVDHVVPKSLGGSDDLDNLVLACSFCSMAKHDNDVGQFLRWLSHVRSRRFVCGESPVVKPYLDDLEDSIREFLV